MQHNSVDYRCLARCFDAVLCNDIVKLFYSTIDGEYSEPEQVNGYIDNSDAISELQDQLDAALIPAHIDELQERIDELQREQDEQCEYYQYYIISDNGARLLQDYTSESVFYLPALDI